jgi:hypothetical protein
VASTVITSIVLSGGPVFTTITSDIFVMTPPPGEVETVVETFQTNTFKDTTHFDTIALIMSKGDTSGIMLTTVDEWKNLSSLTISDVIYNLNIRTTNNLPPMVGKYMLPINLIKDHMKLLGIPPDKLFTSLLQDQLMTSITNAYTNRLHQHNIVVFPEDLFAAHYFASADAWAALVTDHTERTVDQILHDAGYYTRESNAFIGYSKNDLITKIKTIYRLALNEVKWRKANNIDVITSGSEIESVTGYTSVDENGYRIGNIYFDDINGGYFPNFQYIPNSSDWAIVGPSPAIGAVGTVSVTLADAGACALAGVLQTDNVFDQAAIAQIIINRTGGTVAELVSFEGRTCFDNATTLDAFSAISAALFGPNDDKEASDLYGDLYIEHSLLKEVLTIDNDIDFQAALESLFRPKIIDEDSFQSRLTATQMERILQLRTNVYLNGPEINQAQIAIKSSINIVGPGSIASSVILKPQGANASGFILAKTFSGFFIPNTSYAAASAPAVSIDAIYNRLTNNVQEAPSSLTINYAGLLNSQSNALVGSDIVSSGNLQVITTDLDIRRVTNKPDQPNTNNYTGGIPKNNPDYPSYDINNEYIGPGQSGYNFSQKS